MTNSPPSPSGVSDTAFNVARARAEESQQPDRLFDDPLAAAFVARAAPWPTGTRVFELDVPDLFAFIEAVIVQRGLQIRHGGLLSRIHFAPEFLMLAFQKFAAAEAVDRAMLGSSRKPGARIVWYS